MEDLPEDLEKRLDLFFKFQLQKLEEFTTELHFQRCIYSGLLRQGRQWERKPNTLKNRIFYNEICNQILKTSKHIESITAAEFKRVRRDKETFRNDL